MSCGVTLSDGSGDSGGPALPLENSSRGIKDTAYLESGTAEKNSTSSITALSPTKR
jgi:hypothetical protein